MFFFVNTLFNNYLLSFTPFLPKIYNELGKVLAKLLCLERPFMLNCQGRSRAMLVLASWFAESKSNNIFLPFLMHPAFEVFANLKIKTAVRSARRMPQ